MFYIITALDTLKNKNMNIQAIKLNNFKINQHTNKIPQNKTFANTNKEYGYFDYKPYLINFGVRIKANEDEIFSEAYGIENAQDVINFIDKYKDSPLLYIKDRNGETPINAFASRCESKEKFKAFCNYANRFPIAAFDTTDDFGNNVVRELSVRTYVEGAIEEFFNFITQLPPEYVLRENQIKKNSLDSVAKVCRSPEEIRFFIDKVNELPESFKVLPKSKKSTYYHELARNVKDEKTAQYFFDNVPEEYINFKNSLKETPATIIRRNLNN